MKKTPQEAKKTGKQHRKHTEAPDAPQGVLGAPKEKHLTNAKGS